MSRLEHPLSQEELMAYVDGQLPSGQLSKVAEHVQACPDCAAAIADAKRLSRQMAVVRKQSLIINLPGQPKAIKETLEGLKDESGKSVVSGIFAAVPYCIDLIGGPYLETNDDVCKAFRPKSAIRQR